MKKLVFLISLLVFASTSFICGQKRVSQHLEHGAHRLGKRTDANMERWRGHGLGQFIHWGVYSIPGGEWKGERYTGAAEWIRAWKNMPNDEYDNLYRKFNPVNFNAERWASQAAQMGAKYMIFTTKHHDGFCLWPSNYTDYTIANTPFKRDIVGELVEAYTAKGIDVHLYFSIMDWSHPGYRSAPAQTDEEKQAYELFKLFTRNQLMELITNYPQIKGLWFDGTWDKAWEAEGAWADELGKELRSAIPGIIIGSRFRADDNGRRGYDSNGDLMGDYDQGWERDMPNTIEQTNGVDWDCIMTIPENQWGYNANWNNYIKTPFELTEMLVKCVSLNGNFVLNFGPDQYGSIRTEETLIAEKIGQWMKVNSEAIYGCEYVPLPKQDWGYMTGKDGKIYLSVFNMPLDGKLKLEIPKDEASPLRAYLLEDGTELEIINAGRNKRNDKLFRIQVPIDNCSRKPFIVVLEMTKDQQAAPEYQQALT